MSLSIALRQVGVHFRSAAGKTCFLLLPMLSLVGVVCLSAKAQSIYPDASSFPNKPLHLIVPFPAGGALDMVARIIAKPLGERLNQSVWVDNRPGADGAIAADYVAKSNPDGYTLFMATYGSMSALPALHKSLPYDVVNDFTPITNTGKFDFFLFTHPSVPAHHLSEFFDHVKTHPGEVNYGTGNVGGIVASAELSNHHQLQMVHIPYKGEVPLMSDLLSGRIQMMIGTPANALEFVKTGKLNALAAFADQRSHLLPHVPTMTELGYKNLSTVAWSGVFGPAKMPAPVTSLLSKTINEIMLRPEVIQEFAKQGFEAKGSTPSELGFYVKAQLRSWTASIELAGLHSD